jgi:hypothetical protein
MVLSREEIQDLYSRIPVLTPPPHIFKLENAEIGAERLFHMTHAVNGARRRMNAERLRILGMHQMGTDFVTLSGDSEASTVVHEAVHAMGVRSEPATYAITRGLMARARLNLGLRRRPVSYEEVGVAPSERDAFLTAMHLDNPSGGSVQLVHLVYVP